jgi:hypothetical protein
MSNEIGLRVRYDEASPRTYRDFLIRSRSVAVVPSADSSPPKPSVRFVGPETSAP